MEGIPVKISEQYKPPKKISLPGSMLNKLNTEIQFEEYDFSLERSVVEQLARLREVRKSTAEEKRKKHEASQLEESAKQLSLTTPVPVSCQNDPILTPTPISSIVFQKKQSDVIGPINLSDFESDTSSPFDNMELKTINDLEELAHVLGADKSEDKPCGGPSLPPPNGLVQGSHFGWTAPPSYWLNGTVPLRSYVVQSVHSSPVVSPPPTSDCCAPSTSAGHHCAPVNTIPDIMQCLQDQLQERRALTQPKPSTSSKVATNSTAGKDAEPVWLKVNSDCAKPSTLPNPIGSLSGECQALARRVAEMGFSLPRAARAVQLFGNDEAKVIEFLLQVQTLEDQRRLPGDRVERALIANGYREESTVSYLERLQQLINLGFREEQVIQALERTNNDWDGALDSLIS